MVMVRPSKTQRAVCERLADLGYQPVGRVGGNLFMRRRDGNVGLDILQVVDENGRIILTKSVAAHE